MSLPRYEQYKDSGVEWLGEVPAHWAVVTVKRFATFVYGDALPSETRDEDGAVPVFGSNGAFSCHNQANTQAPAILVGRKGSCGALNWSEVPVFAIDTVYFIDPRSCHTNLRWCYWALHTAGLDTASQDTGVPGLSREFAYNVRQPLPPMAEQTAIASFLDRETSKIDNLIAEQRNLIGLLKEKRQALISHAVTKGLDPAAPMKDSGIEWLGEVPKHWGVKRLKFAGEAVIGLTYDPTDVVNEDKGVLVLRSSNVQQGRIVFDDNVYVKRQIPQKLIVQRGDVLICSRNGSRALIGKNALIGADAEGVTFGAFMTVFRSKLNPYLFWLFNSPLFEFQSGAFLTSTINQLTVGTLYGFAVPLPPEQEMDRIVDFLDHETTKIDDLMAEAESATILLQERRTALISAAVTGKIDVRNRKTVQPVPELEVA